MASRRPKGEGSLSQRADGRWTARVDLGRGLDGKRLRKTVYGTTRQEAAAKLRALLGQRARGELVLTPRTTVAEYLTRWIADVVVPIRAPQTTIAYRSILAARLAPLIGEVQLGRLSTPQLQACVRTWQAAGYAPQTIKGALNMLRAALDQAVAWGLLGSNPAVGVHLPRVPRHEARALTVPEARRVLTLAAAPGEEHGPLFALALTTGLRLGELLGLRWEDDQGDVLLVRRSVTRRADTGWTTKAPKSDSGVRAIPLLPMHRSILDQHRRRWGAAEGWLWPAYDGQPLRQYQAQRAWRQFVARHALPAITPHQLRHSVASLLVSLGVPINVVAAILGHSRATITLEVYSHLLPDATRDAMTQLDTLLRSPTEDEP